MTYTDRNYTNRNLRYKQTKSDELSRMSAKTVTIILVKRSATKCGAPLFVYTVYIIK
ncbi:hypothetical protein HMPREF0239_00670 [Clostridium sp. ATCC BAA-442]|nr:hypothetical protein HMPREF0239_00670 [Clostridium sp. ATCC BAA-442]